MNKEEILYNAIESRGGLKGVSFNEFKNWIENGDIDMRKGLESSFAAMSEYAEQTAIAFMEWKEREGYVFYSVGGYSKPNSRESFSETELYKLFKKGI